LPDAHNRTTIDCPNPSELADPHSFPSRAGARRFIPYRLFMRNLSAYRWLSRPLTARLVPALAGLALLATAGAA